jgi:hypothetical protein
MSYSNNAVRGTPTPSEARGNRITPSTREDTKVAKPDLYYRDR